MKRARLRAITVDCHRFALQRLRDEVGHHAPVIHRHARSVRVENSRHSNFQTVLAMVIERQRFSAPFALIVTRAFADRIDVAPVRFRLRVLERIAVHLRRAREQEFRLAPLREPERVHSPQDVGFDRLHRIEFVMNRRRRARQVIHFVDLHQERRHDVVSDDFKLWIPLQVLQVALRAGEKVVHDDDFVAAFQQRVDEVRPDEAGTTGDEHAAGFTATRARLGHGRRWRMHRTRNAGCSARRDARAESRAPVTMRTRENARDPALMVRNPSRVPRESETVSYSG